MAADLATIFNNLDINQPCMIDEIAPDDLANILLGVNFSSSCPEPEPSQGTFTTANTSNGPTCATDSAPDPTQAASQDSSQGPTNRSERHVGPACAHHDVTLEYPALKLLPPSTRPFLYEPKDIEYRQCPHFGDFIKDKSDLAFVVQLRTRFAAAEAMPPDDEGMYGDNILGSMARLQAPGVSNLEVLSYKYFESGPMFFKTRLTTVWMTAFGPSREEVWDFDCDEETFWRHIKSQNSEWSRLLSGLICRSTDRSFLLVQELMQAHSPRMVRKDAERISAKWWKYGASIGPANLVLWRILLDGRPANYVQIPNTVAPFQLPCGHAVQIAPSTIEGWSEAECKAVRCQTCQKLVLEERHYERIALYHDQAARQMYLNHEASWELIHQNIKDKGYEDFTVTFKDFRAALQDALQIMKSPASVMPAELDPINARETKVLLEAFLQNFRVDEAPMVVELRKTKGRLVGVTVQLMNKYAGLTQTDHHLLRHILIPGHARFTVLWMFRSLMLLAEKFEDQQRKGREQQRDLAKMMGRIF